MRYIVPGACGRTWLQSIILALLIGFMLVAGSGCDSAGPTESFEVEVDATFRFSFDPNGITVGRLNDLASLNQEDLNTKLSQKGVSKEQIQTARVKDAVLKIFLPIDEPVSFMDHVIIGLTAAGSRDTEVANQDIFPDDPNEQDASLAIISGRDVTNFLTAPTFTAYMQVQPDALQMDEAQYEIAIQVTFSITVTDAVTPEV